MSLPSYSIIFLRAGRTGSQCRNQRCSCAPCHACTAGRPNRSREVFWKITGRQSIQGFPLWVTIPHNVNPGLINHGLLIRGYPPNSHNMVHKWYPPIKQPRGLLIQGWHYHTYYAGWWFGTWILFVHIFSYIGKNHPNWRTHIFQDGWNHQPAMFWPWHIWCGFCMVCECYDGYTTDEEPVDGFHFEHSILIL